MIHMSASCEAPDGQASAGVFTCSADDLAPAPSTTPLRSRSRWAEYACCRAQSRGSLAFRTSEQQADGAQLAADAEQHKHDEVLDLTRRFVEHDSHVTFMLDKLEEVRALVSSAALGHMAATLICCDPRVRCSSITYSQVTSSFATAWIDAVQAGCPFPKDRIVVARCDRPVSGFFSTENHGLTLCYDNYQGRPAVLRNTLVHELVHAYDQCRGRDVDFLNCKHLACTEVCSSWCKCTPWVTQLALLDAWVPACESAYQSMLHHPGCASWRHVWWILHAPCSGVRAVLRTSCLLHALTACAGAGSAAQRGLLNEHGVAA